MTSFQWTEYFCDRLLLHLCITYVISVVGKYKCIYEAYFQSFTCKRFILLCNLIYYTKQNKSTQCKMSIHKESRKFLNKFSSRWCFLLIFFFSSLQSSQSSPMPYLTSIAHTLFFFWFFLSFFHFIHILSNAIINKLVYSFFGSTPHESYKVLK